LVQFLGVRSNIAAWGAVKEILRINDGQATREQILMC
jgi:hypothetical protein